MNEKPMTKDEYIKYLLNYLVLKQKNILSEMERSKKIESIQYFRGSLAHTVDMIGYLNSEYKIGVGEEETKKVNNPGEIEIDGVKYRSSGRTKDLILFFLYELECVGERNDKTLDFINYLMDSNNL